MSIDLYQTTHGWDRKSSPSTTIIEAIAAATGSEPTDMEPFYFAIDLEALDRLLASLRQSKHPNGDDCVAFTVDGHRVTVVLNGEITIRRDVTNGTDMTRGGPIDEEPMDENEFQRALAHLLRRAEAASLDVEGGWTCRTETDSTWRIEICEGENHAP